MIYQRSLCILRLLVLSQLQSRVMMPGVHLLRPQTPPHPLTPLEMDRKKMMHGVHLAMIKVNRCQYKCTFRTFTFVLHANCLNKFLLAIYSNLICSESLL